MRCFAPFSTLRVKASASHRSRVLRTVLDASRESKCFAPFSTRHYCTVHEVPRVKAWSGGNCE